MAAASCLLLANGAFAQRRTRTPLPPAPPQRPNVVLIVSDDVGYADFGFQGSPDIRTPSLDRLVHDGVRFTDAYAASPLCSPSRGGLLTGRYPMRWGQELNPNQAAASDSSYGVSRQVALLSERLKVSGYATGAIGKWHLGVIPSQLPTARGFDEFYGFLGAEHTYVHRWFGGNEGKIYRGTTKQKPPDFLTSAFGTEAVSFIDRHATSPFFLYVAFNAAHEPLVYDPAHVAAVASIKDRQRRKYASVIRGMDDAIGRILAALDRHQLSSNTIVVFANDNGGPSKSSARNLPLRGEKGKLFDGAIRVPMAIRWPGVIAPGIYRQPVTLLDIVPTVMAATATPAAEPFDGVNLRPFLAGQGTAVPHDSLFWRVGGWGAARAGRWKAIWWRDGPGILFDLQSDIGESTEVSKVHLDVMRRLRSSFDAWARQMQPPKWGLKGGDDGE